MWNARVMDFRDMPQIGSLTVEPELVAGPGEPLEQLLARLGESGAPEVEAQRSIEPQALPIEGWRTLTNDRDLVIGAPIGEDRGSWRVAHLTPASPAHPNGLLRIHPYVLPLRPSRSERARGLRLEWPEVTRSEPDLEHLWIDIVNDGDERWRPNGDGFHVAAGIVRSGRDETGYAFVAGRDGAFPLDPGEYGRVRAHLDLGGLDGIEPGEVQVFAWLVDLSIRSVDPIRVRITPEMLERRRAAVAARPPRHDVAAGRTSRIAMLRTVLTARKRLRDIVEILLEPSTDRKHSVHRIADLLDCSLDDAQGIYSMSLQRFDLQHEDWALRELEELERMSSEPDGAASTQGGPS